MASLPGSMSVEFINLVRRCGEKPTMILHQFAPCGGGGGFVLSGGFGVVSGVLPAERSLMNLPRTSNQNGAPNEIARIVSNQPSRRSGQAAAANDVQSFEDSGLQMRQPISSPRAAR